MIGEQLKALGSAIRSSVWLLDGIEPNTGEALRVICAGGDRQKEYVARLIFNCNCRHTRVGKLYLPQIQYLLHRNSSNSSLAFIEGQQVHRYLYKGKRDFYIPLWLESRVRIPMKAPTKGAREDLRRIRKNKLSYELRSDTQAIKDFYENMYLPTIKDRHENTAVCVSYEEVERVLGRPGNRLLLVRHKEASIAGVVVQLQEVPRLWIGGIRDSSNDFRRMGAVGATYHFPAQYLAELGYSEMNLGRSRSFMYDGIFRYKGKWGHEISGFDRDGVIVKVLTVTKALSGFLANQPFVSVDNGQLQANVFVDVLNQPGEGIAADIQAFGSGRGLSGVRLFIVDGERGIIRSLDHQ